MRRRAGPVCQDPSCSSRDLSKQATQTFQGICGQNPVKIIATIEIRTLGQNFYIVLVISLDFRKNIFIVIIIFLFYTLTTMRSERCDGVQLGQLTLFLFSNVVVALAYIATAIPLISFSSFSLRYKPSSASHISLPFPAL